MEHVWEVFKKLIIAAGIAYAAVATGLVPAPEDVVAQLVPAADEIPVATDIEHADALMLVFAAVIVGPIAGIIGAVVALFLLAVVHGFVRSLLAPPHWPAWAATLVVVALVAGTAWATLDLWLPRSVWLVRIITLAYRVALS